MLRDYQQKAYDSIISVISKSTDRVMIEAATGSGKSHIIAELAHFISKRTDKKIICLAPSKELVEQNHSKYIAIGEKASFFSASIGEKCMRYPVVFATPMTLKNSINQFKGKVSAIIIDECHNIGNTIKSIVSDLAESNHTLRVVGMTATPYRTKKGYIFVEWPGDNKNNTSNAVDPYFKKMTDRITAHELIEKGYLTPPNIGDTKESYDTSGLQTNNMGIFDAKSVDRAFVGKGRLTSNIIADIIDRSRNRKGVIIFCATIEHAQETIESLPPDMSSIVTGKTTKQERADILKKFKSKKLKYLVNVAVLTTGFDAPHIDVVALLRATESPGLMQQIIGRGLRLDTNKDDCLILDYAENIKRHCPDGDIFNPELAIYQESKGDKFEVKCELCEGLNQFAPVDNIENLKYNEYGYLTDLTGSEITNEDGDKITVHHGRRCSNFVEHKGEFKQCPQRYNSKPCPECDMPNDITARKCTECGAEIIDPNEKLKLDFARFKRSPMNRQTDLIDDVKADRKLSMKGNDTLVIEWKTPYRRFKSYHTPAFKQGWYDLFLDNKIDDVYKKINTNTHNLKSITYQKKNSGFYEISAFNRVPDEINQT